MPEMNDLRTVVIAMQAARKAHIDAHERESGSDEARKTLRAYNAAWDAYWKALHGGEAVLALLADRDEARTERDLQIRVVEDALDALEGEGRITQAREAMEAFDTILGRPIRYPRNR